MATIKVKLRLSSVTGKPGTIYYQLIHLRRVQQITTKMHLYPDDWDAETLRVKVKDEATRMIQSRIDSDVARLQGIIQALESDKWSYAVVDVVRAFGRPHSECTISDFFTKQIRMLTECNRMGTARNYRKTLESLTRFLQGAEPPFCIVTETFVEKYNTYLVKRGVVRNTISFYMRIFRAVYNKAVSHGLVEQTSPFRNVYTGVDTTRKRAVSERVIARLNLLDLRNSKPLAFARDLFLFSFYTRGMAFVDIAYLRKSDLHDGYIVYHRHKTAQELCVRIEPGIREIIARYETPGSPYVFPILNSDDTARAYSQYEVALNYYNRLLKRLAELVGTDLNFSSYTPRHSWATVARDMNVPISVISAGMGHSSERTTRIYLKKMENSVIDDANKAILDSMNL